MSILYSAAHGKLNWVISFLSPDSMVLRMEPRCNTATSSSTLTTTF